MSKIEIDYTKVCPYLVQHPVDLKPMSVDLQTGLETDDRCEVGENFLDSEVKTDLMTMPTTVEVELHCEGCKLYSSGFTKTIQAEVKN